MSHFKPLPALADLKKELSYDPETGEFTWIISRRGVRIGTTAGNRNKRGYLSIYFRSIPYKAHRLAWLYLTGADPEHLEVDHRDRVPSNNRANNLRIATGGQNSLNRVRKGYTKRRGKYVARLWHQGKYLHIGTFATAEEAHQAYLDKASELRGEWFAA